MTPISLPEDFGPQAAPGWFAVWAGVADQPDLILAGPPPRNRPTGVVLLAAGGAARRLEGRHTQWAAAGAMVDPPAIADLRIARKLADAAGTALEAAQPRLSPSILRLARFVIEELGANVVQHSGRPTTGFGAWHAGGSPPRLEIAFADRGVGFRRSLERNSELAGRVADDAEALQLAVSPRVSGTAAPRSNMGIGLKILLDFADLLGGDVWLASGAALLHRRTVAGGQRANVLRAVVPWPGSWVCLDAPLG
jgi:hypothetical protein